MQIQTEVQVYNQISLNVFQILSELKLKFKFKFKFKFIWIYSKSYMNLNSTSSLISNVLEFSPILAWIQTQVQI
jgi:hypothetical protein